MKVKKHKPIVYDYYEYLKKEHMGAHKGISRSELAEIMGVTVAVQKSILSAINQSDSLERLISTSGSIYMCQTKEECVAAYMNEIRSGLTRLNKGKVMANKVQMNGQGKIKLGAFYKDFVETFEE